TARQAPRGFSRGQVSTKTGYIVLYSDARRWPEALPGFLASKEACFEGFEAVRPRTAPVVDFAGAGRAALCLRRGALGSGRAGGTVPRRPQCDDGRAVPDRRQ